MPEPSKISPSLQNLEASTLRRTPGEAVPNSDPFAVTLGSNPAPSQSGVDPGIRFKEPASGSSTEERFLREARITARLPAVCAPSLYLSCG
jgi:hypothetical protein